MEVMAERSGVSFRGEEHVLKRTVVLVARSREYTKNH